jgi:hypothetical protein
VREAPLAGFVVRVRMAEEAVERSCEMSLSIALSSWIRFAAVERGCSEAMLWMSWKSGGWS